MIHQRGMTLIEVLIAGIILFIAIAALSFVARVQVEHQIRFEKTIEQAYLSEFLVDKVKYHLNYTEQQSGTIDYRGQLFEWRAKLSKQKSVVMGVSPEDNFDQSDIAPYDDTEYLRDDTEMSLSECFKCVGNLLVCYFYDNAKIVLKYYWRSYKGYFTEMKQRCRL